MRYWKLGFRDAATTTETSELEILSDLPSLSGNSLPQVTSGTTLITYMSVYANTLH
jgi:hypothetical protein